METNPASGEGLQKAAERAAQQPSPGTTLGESGLLQLLDAAAEAITVQGPGGELLYLNPVALRALGLPPDTQAAQVDSAALSAAFQVSDEHGRPVAPEDQPWVHALMTGVSSDRLLTYRRDGDPVQHWTVVRSRAFTAGGAVQYVMTCWTDVTDLQETRAALRRQRALLDTQVEASPDGILMVSAEGHILSYNQRFLELWNLSPALVAPGDDAAALAGVTRQMADPEGFLERVREIYRTRENSYDEVALADGRLFERYSASIEGGSARVWFFRDVTERRRAEQQQRQLLEERAARRAAEEAKRHWELLAEISRRLSGSLDLGTVLTGVAQLGVPRFGDCCIVDLADGQGLRRALVQHADPALAPAASRLQALVPDLRSPHGVPQVLQSGVPLARALESPGPWGPLGEPAEAEAIYAELGLRSVFSLPLALGPKVLGVVTFARAEARPPSPDDQHLARELAHRAALAVEHARLYRQAQEAVALRDDFLSVASHELRTPVTALHLALQSLVRMVGRAAGPAPELLQLVHLAERQELRLGRLVDALLDVTRLQGNRLELELEPVDLAEVASAAAGLLAGEANQRGSPISVRAARPVVGRWDRSRLEQVVTNLLSNAVKYGAGRPVELEVGPGPRPGWARLAVSDQGIGIAPEFQGAIFGRFERAASTRHFAGLGLGLYIARGIIEALGGTIAVSSRPGAGSRFAVDLPLAGPPRRAP